jgi:hypothetical protein
MKRILFAFAALTLFAPLAYADPQYDVPATFSSLDSYERTGENVITLTGIVSGQSSATSIQYRNYSNGPLAITGCEHAAMMMLNRPGRFSLEVNDDGNGTRCKLIRQ